MPTVALGAAALTTNSAMVSTITMMRPVLLDANAAMLAMCFILVLLLFDLLMLLDKTISGTFFLKPDLIYANCAANSDSDDTWMEASNAV